MKKLLISSLSIGVIFSSMIVPTFASVNLNVANATEISPRDATMNHAVARDCRFTELSRTYLRTETVEKSTTFGVSTVFSGVTFSVQNTTKRTASYKVYRVQYSYKIYLDYYDSMAHFLYTTYTTGNATGTDMIPV